MDDNTFKQYTERLMQVGKVLEKLPPEIRLESFALFKNYIIKSTSDIEYIKSGSRKKNRNLSEGVNSKENLFRSFTHDKPADNVKLIAAYLYGEYGSSPFSIDEVNKMSNEVGITIPSRIDMTLSAAKDKGKKLFNKVGKGMFKPTVHGEAYLKEQYKVGKGQKKRPEATK